MPYIKEGARELFDSKIEALDDITDVGELNYVITRLTLRLLTRMGVNYKNISTVVGTLALVPTEIGRRLIHPYEDTKIKQNSDVREFKEFDDLY